MEMTKTLNPKNPKDLKPNKNKDASVILPRLRLNRFHYRKGEWKFTSLPVLGFHPQLPAKSLNLWEMITGKKRHLISLL